MQVSDDNILSDSMSSDSTTNINYHIT